MQQSSPTLIMIIAAISLTIGYVAGWLISSFTKRKGAGETEKGEDLELKERIGQVERPEVPPGNPTGAYRPFLRLWREEKGRLLVEYEGKSLVTANTLLPEQRKRLEVILREMVVWLGLMPGSANAAPASPPVETVKPAATPTPPAVTRTGPTDVVVPTVNQTPKPTTLVEGMTVGLANVLNPAPVKREVPKTIVEQINEVVQELLAESPLAGQKIYLSEDPRRGVVVWAQGHSFEGIDSVPPGEIKDLLKRSVAEWERRQEEQLRRV